MSDLDAVRGWTAGALAALESARRRIDDLNVYPVPDGDTGTNLTLTVRAMRDSLADADPADRAALAHTVTRAALMGARGNSGVIFSQVVRGAADELGSARSLDPGAPARALRGASDAAYRAVKRPVEGTMLSVIRELAEEAESSTAATPAELLRALVARGEQAVARTQETLDVLRDAGVVDAGGAGLLELLRGVAAAVGGEPLAPPPPELESVGVDAVHRERSRYRYCTVFLIEGGELDRDAIEAELERIGDSLLVVGDAAALKVHVHTDEPGAALAVGTRTGTIARVEIANMHEQAQERENRLLRAVPEPDDAAAQSAVVAVVAGAGNRRLFESLGAAAVVEGGQTMNPATAELLAAIESLAAHEILLLPNNSNVLLAAEQAATLASMPVEVVATGSVPAGLAAMVAFDPERSAAENAEEMRERAAGVGAGEVTRASRDADVDGIQVRKGEWIGLADGTAVAAGDDFDAVACAVAERLLERPREVLTLLTGADEPELDPLLARLREAHPGVEVEVQAGGQPHYPLLLAAE